MIRIESAQYNADKIAKYMINKSIDMGTPISNLKLQKLLYYAQAASILENSRSLFSEEILSWQYGPVVESIYHNYKTHSYKDIIEKIPVSKEDELDEETKSMLDNLLEAKKDDSAYDMVYTTHQEKPWLECIDYEVISIEAIKEYFEEGDNRNRIWKGRRNLE